MVAKAPQAQRRSRRPRNAGGETNGARTAAIDDGRGPMGIRLVVQHQGDECRLLTSGASFLLPVHAGLSEVQLGARCEQLDSGAWLVAPRGTRLVVRAHSPVAHTLVLTVSPALAARTVDLFHGEIDAGGLERYLSTSSVLKRTVWVNELAHRYLFERAVCGKRDNDATRFIEAELVKEAYFLCRDRELQRERPSLLAGESELVQRALAALEEHLFEPDVLDRVQSKVAASPSTLLRAFKKERLGSPLAFVRARRLDEALLMLKSHRLTIGEVATRVGYRNFAAFSAAFRARFGLTPSEARAQR